MAIKSEYLKGIIALAVSPLREAIDRLLIPKLESLVQHARAERGDSADPFRKDAAHAQASALIARIAKQINEDVTPAQIARLAERIGRRASEHQRSQLFRQVKAALGVDPILHEPAIAPRLEQFAAHNVSLIKSIPSRFFDDVEKRVLAGIRAGDRASDIADDLQDRIGVAETDAARIANDQVGKLVGQMNEVRQTALGIESYTWRGMMDNRERQEHEDREGETFDWEDPPEGGHPGEDINCRCWAEPNLEDFFAEASQ